MFVETLENRRLFAGRPDGVPPPPPEEAPVNAVAVAAQAGTVDETAQADGQAVAALARGT
jgi:hypothetical protein